MLIHQCINGANLQLLTTTEIVSFDSMAKVGKTRQSEHYMLLLTDAYIIAA